MAKKERNPGSVGRARAKRKSSEAPRGRAILGLDENSYERTGDSFRGPMHFRQAGMPSSPFSPAAAAVAGKDYSPRPTPRPVRGEMESSPRPTPRPYTMEERGAAERGDRAAEREAQKFADGGMVRGCKAAQMTGKKFSGNY